MTVRDGALALAATGEDAAAIRRLTCFDGLTGLPNRLLFREQLDLVLRLARREGRHVAVLLGDIDGFRRIKSAVGHRGGDEVIRSVAGRIVSTLRNADIVARDIASSGQPSAAARVSSNEFAMVLTRIAEPHDAQRVAQRLQKAVGAEITVGESVVHPTLCVGAALFPQDGNSADELLERAEAALCRAKESGRDRVHFFSTALDDTAAARLALENELRVGLRRGEIVPHYQPRVDARTGRIVGAEALARWMHPTRGLVPAGEFISAAERCGLIGALGETMLETVCRQNMDWQHAGFPAIPLSVNISAVQVSQHDFAAVVARVLERSGLAPGCLELEITETLLMNDAQRALRTFGAIREKGVRIAIDDFGTGYSSLAYLRDFQFDTLKIDRSFVHGLPSDERLAALTTTVIDMSRRLGLEVVAEGVETEAEERFLLDNGCPHMQGFRFSRAVEAAAFESRWRRSLDQRRASAARPLVQNA